MVIPVFSMDGNTVVCNGMTYGMIAQAVESKECCMALFDNGNNGYSVFGFNARVPGESTGYVFASTGISVGRVSQARILVSESGIEYTQEDFPSIADTQ